jgi:hypothetical protein
MKITNQQLRQIIKEELENVLNETNGDDQYKSPLLRNVPKVSGRRYVSGEYDPRQMQKYGQGKYLYKGNDLNDAIDQNPRLSPENKEKLKTLLNSDEEGFVQARELLDTLDVQDAIYSSDNDPFAPGRDGFEDEPYIHRIHMSPSEKERYERYEFMGQRGQEMIRDEEMMKQYVGDKGPRKQFHSELDPTHPSRRFGSFNIDSSEIPRITDEQIEQMKKEKIRKSVRKDLDYEKRLKK